MTEKPQMTYLFNVIDVAGIFPAEISMVLSPHLKDSNFREVAHPSIVPQYWLNIVSTQNQKMLSEILSEGRQSQGCLFE